MGMKVTTVERIEKLAIRAKKVFAVLKFDICSFIGDGHYGYPPNAPYKGIIITTATSEIENSWLGQLEIGGKLVLPMNVQQGMSRLEVICMNEKKEYTKETYDFCRFVPLLQGIKERKGK
jgi:protein-L-isoaspartate(D-aspartate) O-methyltransferase